MKLRTKVLSAAVTGAAAASVLVLPQTAQAATPTCNNTTGRYVSSTRIVDYPVYRTSSSNTVDCVMGKGAQSYGVYDVQRAAKLCYGINLDLDSIYGDKTYNAVYEIQRREGISKDGVYGPVTRKAMNWPTYSSSNGSYVGCYEWNY